MLIEFPLLLESLMYQTEPLLYMNDIPERKLKKGLACLKKKRKKGSWWYLRHITYNNKLYNIAQQALSIEFLFQRVYKFVFQQ